MLKTRIAAPGGRHGVDRVFFWIEHDRPGVCCRWYLDNETTVLIPPGEHLDLNLSAETFKRMMSEHLSLQRSVSAEVVHYLRQLQPLLVVAACVIIS